MEVIWTGSFQKIGDRWVEFPWGFELFADLIDGTLYRLCRGKEQPHLRFGTLKLRKMNRGEIREYNEWVERRAAA